jgi:hypothetical protein
MANKMLLKLSKVSEGGKCRLLSCDRPRRVVQRLHPFQDNALQSHNHLREWQAPVQLLLWPEYEEVIRVIPGNKTNDKQIKSYASLVSKWEECSPQLPLLEPHAPKQVPWMNSAWKHVEFPNAPSSSQGTQRHHHSNRLVNLRRAGGCAQHER